MNIERVERTLSVIKLFPEQHNQGVWHCGTRHCFAGWANILESGVSVKEFEKLQEKELGRDNFYLPEKLFPPDGDGVPKNSSETAKEWLELTKYEANKLFDSHTEEEDEDGNKIEMMIQDLEECIKDLIELQRTKTTKEKGETT